MQNPLVLKLKRFAALSEAEIDAVCGLSGQKRGVDAGCDVIRQGDKPPTVALILEGLACRYKLTEAGERQIVGIMVPGDLCDLHAFLLDKMDHSIAALTNLTLTYISREKLIHLFDTEPRITRALWWGTLVDESTLREWLMNVATRSSYERLAHLLSELCMRLETVGLATPEGCDIPIRQTDLADAVGLGRQNVNSSLAKLQEEGLVDLRRGGIRVLDVNGMRAAGQFNQHYLHVQNG